VRAAGGKGDCLGRLLITLAAFFLSCDTTSRDLIAAYATEHARRVAVEEALERETIYAHSLEEITQRQGRQIAADDDYESNLRVELSDCKAVPCDSCCVCSCPSCICAWEHAE
jgi:hypothetical protein